MSLLATDAWGDSDDAWPLVHDVRVLLMTQYLSPSQAAVLSMTSRKNAHVFAALVGALGTDRIEPFSAVTLGKAAPMVHYSNALAYLAAGYGKCLHIKYAARERLDLIQYLPDAPSLIERVFVYRGTFTTPGNLRNATETHDIHVVNAVFQNLNENDIRNELLVTDILLLVLKTPFFPVLFEHYHGRVRDPHIRSTLKMSILRWQPNFFLLVQSYWTDWSKSFLVFIASEVPDGLELYTIFHLTRRQQGVLFAVAALERGNLAMVNFAYEHGYFPTEGPFPADINHFNSAVSDCLKYLYDKQFKCPLDMPEIFCTGLPSTSKDMDLAHVYAFLIRLNVAYLRSDDMYDMMLDALRDREKALYDAVVAEREELIKLGVVMLERTAQAYINKDDNTSATEDNDDADDDTDDDDDIMPALEPPNDMPRGLVPDDDDDMPALVDVPRDLVDADGFRVLIPGNVVPRNLARPVPMPIDDLRNEMVDRINDMRTRFYGTPTGLMPGKSFMLSRINMFPSSPHMDPSLKEIPSSSGKWYYVKRKYDAF